MLSLISDEVITWGYDPGVVGVIDAELSELWGYKVIPLISDEVVITLGLTPTTPGLLGLQGYNSIYPGYDLITP